MLNSTDISPTKRLLNNRIEKMLLADRNSSATFGKSLSFFKKQESGHSLLERQNSFNPSEANIYPSTSGLLSQSILLRPDGGNGGDGNEKDNEVFDREWDEYKKQCKHIGVVPVGMLERQIKTNSLQLPFYGLEDRGARALGYLLNVRIL